MKFFNQMGETMGQLQTLAKKELAGEAVTADETTFIKKAARPTGVDEGFRRTDPGGVRQLSAEPAPSECRLGVCTVAGRGPTRA